MHHYLKLNLKTIIILTIFVLVTSNTSALEFSKPESSVASRYLSKAIKSKDFKESLVGLLIAMPLKDESYYKEQYRQKYKFKFNKQLWLDQKLKACLYLDVFNKCDAQLLITNLKHLDSTNAFPYFYSAILKVKDNDLAGALEELRRATKQEHIEDYYWKRFSLVLDELQQLDGPNDYIYTASTKLAHNLVTEPYKDLINICKVQSKQSLSWKSACLSAGKLLEEEGNIFFANMVGLAIQRNALSFDRNDVERLAIVKKRRESLNQWRINAVETLDFLEAQKKAPASYYSDLIIHGEKRAVENALQKHQSKLSH